MWFYPWVCLHEPAGRRGWWVSIEDGPLYGVTFMIGRLELRLHVTIGAPA